MSRRGRPPRSLEHLIEGALALVDEVGVERFSMRLLADRLNTGTATIYRHLGGKDELLVLIVDRLIAEAVAPGVGSGSPTGDWQPQIRDRSLQLFRALRAHGNLLPLLSRQVPLGPNALAAREQAIATFVRHGFSVQVAARAYTTIGNFIVNSAQAAATAEATGADAHELGSYFRSLQAERYPHTIAAAEALTAVSAEQEFLEALQMILDGVSAARER